MLFSSGPDFGIFGVFVCAAFVRSAGPCPPTEAGWVRFIFFGQAVATRQALHSRKSGQRMFSPAHVFDAAFDGEQGVGARFRPAASRPFESAADDLLAGTFHDAGTDRQSALAVEVVAHSVRVGLAVADEGRDGFGPVAARLQSGNDLGDPP